MKQEQVKKSIRVKDTRRQARDNTPQTERPEIREDIRRTWFEERQP